jgi:hypothetical protein
VDPVRFDSLVKSLSTNGTRRGLVQVLAALPLGVALTFVLSERPEAAEDDDHGSSHRRHRRKARHRHQTGNNKEHRKGQRTGRKPCRPESRAKTCAGRCSTVRNTCGEPVDCGPCTCATGCPECQTCDTATGLCVTAPNGMACDDGDPCTQTDTCQNGTCVGSNPVDCTPASECQVRACDPVSGACTAAVNKPPNTPCNGGEDVCCGGTCEPRDCCDDDGCAGNAVCLSNGSCAIPCDPSRNDCCGNCVPTEGGGNSV